MEKRTIPTLQKPDERVGLVATNGLALCGAAAFIYVVVRIIWCGIHGALAVPELVLLGIMALCIYLNNRANNVANLPRIFGIQLSAAPQDRMKRFGLYAAEAFAFSLVCGLLDYLASHDFSDTWKAALISFVVVFLLNIVMNELAVKRYLAQLTRLNAEENADD
ncbi:MAG: hypothetical protein MJ062_00360 [Oscillospiraceae bacterium]|nr:hypothetical protein [Oscillospiraceae bacterium]